MSPLLGYCTCPVPLGMIGSDQYCDRCRPRPDDEVKLEPEREVVAFPHWCRGVAYNSDRDVVIVTVLVPVAAGKYASVSFEAIPDDAEVFGRAVLTCVERSRRSSSVLDVPSDAT